MDWDQDMNIKWIGELEKRQSPMVRNRNGMDKNSSGGIMEKWSTNEAFIMRPRVGFMKCLNVCPRSTAFSLAVPRSLVCMQLNMSKFSKLPLRSLYTYEELGAALQHLKVETNAETAQILYSHDNVRVYFISPDGSVTATSEPDTLKIVQLNDAGEKTRAYLELGNWIYPLVPDVSPCFRTEYGAFILPDVHSTVEGSAVGIILPEDADASVYDLLDDILHGIATRVPTGEAVMARAGRWKRSGQFSHSISQGLVKGAHYISHGLVKGAVKAGDLMNYGTPRLIQRLTPDPNPTQVSPRVTQGIQVAKNVTGHVVQVTGFLASAIGTATMSLGRFLAPHIQRHGTRLLSSTWNMSESEASEKVDGVFEVAAGAVEGFSTVYEGLECSAAILASNLSNNTVKIVEHKYGHPMAEATGETLLTVGNIFTAAHNVKYFTPKGFVKITAKETGKAIVEDYRASLREPTYQNKPNGGGSSSQVPLTVYLHREIIIQHSCSCPKVVNDRCGNFFFCSVRLFPATFFTVQCHADQIIQWHRHIMGKTKATNQPGRGGSGRSNHSMNPDRKTEGLKGVAKVRSKSTIQRLHMYKNFKARRDPSGKIIRPAPFQGKLPSGTVARVEPSPKWFGNSRVVAQNALQKFQQELGAVLKNPYQVVMKHTKLPVTLLNETRKHARVHLLDTESFGHVFGPKKIRKKPNLKTFSYEELSKTAIELTEKYSDEKDRDLVKEDAGMKDSPREMIMKAGQSKRIWNELYKVIDSSDVVLQVLDARDPQGTRSPHIENFIRTEKPHKHLLFILNKVDLVPTWVTQRWVATLSAEYPTVAFHASLTHPFGKGSLINLLRQFAKLHIDKKQISVGFIGYPNVGKSSVINTLRSKKVCKVAPIAGETKVWQYITLMRRIYLIDCPGVVYPSAETDIDKVLKGVVRVELVQNPEDYIPHVLERVKREYIEKTYKLTEWDTDLEFLEKMAARTGKLLKGGEPDISTVAKMVLNDWQRGKLPFYVFPPGYEPELDSKPASANGEINTTLVDAEINKKASSDNQTKTEIIGAETKIDKVSSSMEIPVSQSDDKESLPITSPLQLTTNDEITEVEDDIKISTPIESMSIKIPSEESSIMENTSNKEVDKETDENTLPAKAQENIPPSIPKSSFKVFQDFSKIRVGLNYFENEDKQMGRVAASTDATKSPKTHNRSLSISSSGTTILMGSEEDLTSLDGSLGHKPADLTEQSIVVVDSEHEDSESESSDSDMETSLQDDMTSTSSGAFVVSEIDDSGKKRKFKEAAASRLTSKMRRRIEREMKPKRIGIIQRRISFSVQDHARLSKLHVTQQTFDLLLHMGLTPNTVEEEDGYSTIKKDFGDDRKIYDSIDTEESKFDYPLSFLPHSTYTTSGSYSSHGTPHHSSSNPLPHIDAYGENIKNLNLANGEDFIAEIVKEGNIDGEGSSTIVKDYDNLLIICEIKNREAK
uniref:Nucleolar GTP-binding protein 2 n=1 Tax=Timema monikensis TaxID=170555 RepID=A0A7R9EBD5_9NEOP|nr:unnamed protein product [Timema monikensis]